MSRLVLAPVLVVVFACQRPDAVERVARVAPEPFDPRGAHELVSQQVAFGPRAPGTPGHERQLAWMQNHLRARADTLLVQPFVHVTTKGDTLRLTNLLARFRRESRERILLVAHWDTRPTADNEEEEAARGQPIPGANDGASGTAVLLELADVLSRHPAPIGVDLLFVDGEDYGPGQEDMYLGATHFAANLPPGYQPLYGILLDMIGDEDPEFPIEAYSQEYAPEVVERVWTLAEGLGYGAVFRRVSGGAINDDHVALNRAGIRTIDIIDFEYGPANAYWHTLEDRVEHTSPKGLEAVGTVLAELIYRGG